MIYDSICCTFDIDIHSLEADCITTDEKVVLHKKSKTNLNETIGIYLLHHQFPIVHDIVVLNSLHYGDGGGEIFGSA